VSVNGKPVERRGRKAKGSKVLNYHYDSLVAALIANSKPAHFYGRFFFAYFICFDCDSTNGDTKLCLDCWCKCCTTNIFRLV